MLRFVVVLTTLLISAYALHNLDLNSINWRIVGGKLAPEGAFPHQVSLRNYKQHFCSGSIIDETTILTAAHCVSWPDPSTLTVVTGTNQLNQSGDVYKVASTIIHSEWDVWAQINDIGIIKLSEPIQFKDNVQPIELDDEEITGNQACVFSGWGRTSNAGPTPNDLQYIDLKTITLEECNEMQSNQQVFISQICTFTQVGQGACKGDSGGPLTRNSKLIGILSWVKPCDRGYPDIYTRVSSFIPWIRERMQHN